MSRRDVVLVDPSGELAGRLEGGGFDGWLFHRVDSALATHEVLETHRCLVGIVVFDNPEGSLATELAKLIDSSACEWVALVAQGLLEHPRIAPQVLEHFHDFHTLPLDPARLRMTLGHAHGKAQMRQQLLDAAPGESATFGMTGTSAAMQTLYRQLAKIVRADVPVLLRGESGVGKELVARAIHRYSKRAAGPFLAMNCAAVPATLIQSELFGHEKGAFTGAHQRRIGNIEASSSGVLFLDEIGDLSTNLQANLLRFLQEMTIVRVGASTHVPVDTRVVAATHVDLEAAVAAGHFRADLFYRLNIVNIRVPALRERIEDVRALARSAFRANLQKKGRQLRDFGEEALLAMEAYQWPGNVRELINRVRRAMIMAEGELITPQDLGLQGGSVSPVIDTLETERSRFDREIILRSLHMSGSNVSEAARRLGVSRGTLYRLMARLDIHAS